MKNIMIISLALLISAPLWGQRRIVQNKNKVEALRIAFITEELQLSTEEAQLFWPIFNDHEQQQKELREERNNLLDQESSQVAGDILVAYLDNTATQHQYTVAYIAKLQEVIPDEKIVRLLTFDKKFKERLLNRLNTKRGGR